MKKIYDRDDLYKTGYNLEYTDDATQAAFLIGGIGTGTISVGSRGDLRDWGIMNKPAMGNRPPYTFFAISAAKSGGKRITKVLESEVKPPFTSGGGYQPTTTMGLPRLDSSVMKCEYPFAWIDFEDSQLPVKVSMEAFNPFIPLDADKSGIPAAIIRYYVKNTSDAPVSVTIAGSMQNIIAFGDRNVEERINEYKDDGVLRGIEYSCTNLAKDSLSYGNMALMTPDNDVTYKEKWLSGGFFAVMRDGYNDFWDDFSDDGMLEKESRYYTLEPHPPSKIHAVSSLGIYKTLEPGESKVFEFILAWYFPNRIKGWGNRSWAKHEDGRPQTIRNYYATKYKNAWDAGSYLYKNLNEFERISHDFRKALYSSTLPECVIDAISANITVIRSNTCYRIEDGTFLAWEGSGDTEGSCLGSCTHVWNYAQTLAFLFPEMEQSMRRVEFNIETDEKGYMSFRTYRVFGLDEITHHPAADGQMGTIIRLYRDWKLSGNTELLKEVWPNACKALDFAFTYWDSDGDFVLDSQQHNTYDIEFYGPNSLVNSLFFTALKAGAEMAEFLGDNERAEKYKKAFQEGSSRMDQMLWNGEYYEQKIDNVDDYRYQYGKGCLSDQLLGQTLAHVTGLGYILPEDHVKTAIKSVFKYNFLTSFKEHSNPQRAYTFNDEKGLLLCNWPKGGRPRLPFVYSDEVWTGIEYQVAAHLIYEGFFDEGLTIVKAVRERHDGFKRNPWNEVECGHHYARTLASWAVMLALSGYKYDLVKGEIGFAPVINSDAFSCFFSNGKAWGIYSQKLNKTTGEVEKDIKVLYGSMDGIKLV